LGACGSLKMGGAVIDGRGASLAVDRKDSTVLLLCGEYDDKVIQRALGRRPLVVCLCRLVWIPALLSCLCKRPASTKDRPVLWSMESMESDMSD